MLSIYADMQLYLLAYVMVWRMPWLHSHSVQSGVSHVQTVSGLLGVWPSGAPHLCMLLLQGAVLACSIVLLVICQLVAFLWCG